jgi:hypothetical protein
MKNEIISKELLSEVLGIEITRIKVKGNILEYNHDFTGYCEDDINIHELAHKCKEWAWGFRNEFRFNLNPAISGEENSKVYIVQLFSSKHTRKLIHGVQADTEPEAIFKACQWILENKAQS